MANHTHRRRKGDNGPNHVPDYFLKRKFPSVERLSKEQMAELFKLQIDYMGFLDEARIPIQVTRNVIARVVGQGFAHSSDDSQMDKIYYSSEEEGCFALAKLGENPLEKGVKMMATHTDSPCLMAKRPRPLRLDVHPDYTDLQPGVEMDVVAYGGIQPHRWAGFPVDIIGWRIKNGRFRWVKLQGHIDEVSAHIENRSVDDLTTVEPLDINLGYSTIYEVLKRLGMKSEDDFASSRVYVVPITNKGGSTHAIPNYIIGYGHDDRACVFTGLEAFLESKTDDPAILFGFDREEIGSAAKSGARGRFLETVLYDVIRRKMGLNPTQITEALLQQIYSNSIMIGADVCVGSNRKNVIHGGCDIYNIAKTGFGAALSADPETAFDYANEINPRLLDAVRSVLHKRGVVHQLVGSPAPADCGAGATHAVFFSNRGINTIDLGLPVSGLHGPSESLATGDLYALKQAYKAVFEAELLGVR